MNQADTRARKNRSGIVAERMANAARLGVLERYLGEPVKRYRDPGLGGGSQNSFTDSEKKDEEVIRLKVESE